MTHRVSINKSFSFLLIFQYITDPSVEPCGSLRLTLEPLSRHGGSHDKTACKAGKGNREIQAKMLFGDTEIKATAVDTATQLSVKAYVNFMNETNPKYVTKL